MRFGPDLNAYTGFDETVYMLQVPTDDPEILGEGLRDPGGLGRRRRVRGRGDRQGARRRHRGVARTARRRRAGPGPAVPGPVQGLALRRAPPDRHRRGAPGLPAQRDHALLPATGTGPTSRRSSPSATSTPPRSSRRSSERFSSLKAPSAPRERIVPDVPDHDETLFSIVTDPELTRTSVSVAFKRDPAARRHRRRLPARAGRVALLRHARRPAGGARAGGLAAVPRRLRERRLVRALQGRQHAVGVGRGGRARSRARGAPDRGRARAPPRLPDRSELERDKTNLLRGYEQAWAERDKTDSGAYVSEYTGNFFEDEPIPGIAFEVEIARRYVPGITVDEVNRLAAELPAAEQPRDPGRGPGGGGSRQADRGAAPRHLRARRRARRRAWKDRVGEGPLLAAELEPVEIVERKQREDVGTTEWKSRRTASASSSSPPTSRTTR